MENRIQCQRGMDSDFASIHARFLGKYFYPELSKENGDNYEYETDAAKQLKGIDWTCIHKDGTVDYIDDKAKADNLSTPRVCDTLSMFAFELSSVQNKNGQSNVRSGWFVDESNVTTIYNIHKVMCRYNDKTSVHVVDDILSSDCWSINKNDLLDNLSKMTGGLITREYLKTIAGKIREEEKATSKKLVLSLYKSGIANKYYFAKVAEDIRRDEAINGIIIVHSSNNKAESPINLVCSTDFLEHIPSTKRYHIDSNGVCVIPRSMSTLTSTGRLIKAVKELKKAQEKISELESSGRTPQKKNPESGHGITRVIGGIYEDVELNDGYFISDDNIREIKEWLLMYHELLEATCKKKNITDGEMFERNIKIHQMLENFK